MISSKESTAEEEKEDLQRTNHRTRVFFSLPSEDPNEKLLGFPSSSSRLPLCIDQFFSRSPSRREASRRWGETTSRREARREKTNFTERKVAFFILSSPTWFPPRPLYSLSLFISRGPPSSLIILSLSGRWTGSPDQPWMTARRRCGGEKGRGGSPRE